MSRELEFDGYWEGAACFTCDNCKKTAKIRFDGEDEAKNYKAQRAALRAHGWIFTQVNGRWIDVCSEKCRNAYTRRNTF